jgi:hypothetical protein
MNLSNPPAHRAEVEDTTEARQALEAADTLGLELRNVKIRGVWEALDGGEPSRGSKWNLYGRTRDDAEWFHLGGNGYQTFAARPRRSRTDCIDDGSLELRFD